VLDKNGVEINAGDRLLGSFYGQGGWWYQYATVRHSYERGLYLEFTDGRTGDFSHPKFCAAERREVVTEALLALEEASEEHFKIQLERIGRKIAEYIEQYYERMGTKP
jgi:hypothetical protein